MAKRIAVKRPKKHGASKIGSTETVPGAYQNNGEQWSDLVAIAERWKSDVEFFHDELKFLHDLVNKHFTQLILNEDAGSARSIVSMLSEIRKRTEILFQDVQGHINHLTGLIENQFSHEATECKNEHAKLEIRMTNFVKDFRSIKKEIFSLARIILQLEKTK